MKKLSFLFIVLAHSLFSQQKKTYTIYVNYPDHNLKAEVLSEPIKIRASNDLEYYWYSSNKILHTYGGCDGKILNGEFTSFYLSGNLKEKGNFKKGLKTGIWTLWFESGIIKETSIWQNGVRTGSTKAYDDKGLLTLENNYRKGKLNSFQRTYENGKLLNEKKYKKGKEILKPVEKEKKQENENTKVVSFKEKMKRVFKPRKKISTGTKNKTTVKPVSKKESKKK